MTEPTDEYRAAQTSSERTRSMLTNYGYGERLDDTTDHRAPIDIPRTRVRIQYRDDEHAACPYCGQRAEAMVLVATAASIELDTVPSAVMTDGGHLPFTMKPETVTYEPCGDTLDTLTGEWNRRD